MIFDAALDKEEVAVLYNSAIGDLTKDHQGYQYKYDYESRIVRIKNSAGANVAEYTYDALGRRIEKKDPQT